MIEATKSKTGKHAARQLLVLYFENGEKTILQDYKESSPTRGTYSRGFARKIDFERISKIPGLAYIIHIYLIRNLRSHVKGRIKVFDKNRTLLYEAVLRNRKIRRVRGDKSYSWIIEDAIRTIGLEDYVRRYNHNTGV